MQCLLKLFLLLKNENLIIQNYLCKIYFSHFLESGVQKYLCQYWLIIDNEGKEEHLPIAIHNFWKRSAKYCTLKLNTVILILKVVSTLLLLFFEYQFHWIAIYFRILSPFSILVLIILLTQETQFAKPLSFIKAL